MPEIPPCQNWAVSDIWCPSICAFLSWSRWSDEISKTQRWESDKRDNAVFSVLSNNKATPIRAIAGDRFIQTSLFRERGSFYCEKTDNSSDMLELFNRANLCLSNHRNDKGVVFIFFRNCKNSFRKIFLVRWVKIDFSNHQQLCNAIFIANCSRAGPALQKRRRFSLHELLRRKYLRNAKIDLLKRTKMPKRRQKKRAYELDI